MSSQACDCSLIRLVYHGLAIAMYCVVRFCVIYCVYYLMTCCGIKKLDGFQYRCVLKGRRHVSASAGPCHIAKCHTYSGPLPYIFSSIYECMRLCMCLHVYTPYALRNIARTCENTRQKYITQ